MIDINSLKNIPDNDPIWTFLKNNSLRERVFDLITSVAMDQRIDEVDVLHDFAIRAWAARVDFARRLDDLLPRSPEDETTSTVEPEPVE